MLPDRDPTDKTLRKIEARVLAIANLDGLSMTEGVVLNQLALLHDWDHDRCFPSLRILTRCCHCHKKTVIRALNQLEERGMLRRLRTRDGQQQRATEYFFLFPVDGLEK